MGCTLTALLQALYLTVQPISLISVQLSGDTCVWLQVNPCEISHTEVGEHGMCNTHDKMDKPEAPFGLMC